MAATQRRTGREPDHPQLNFILMQWGAESVTGSSKESLTPAESQNSRRIEPGRVRVTAEELQSIDPMLRSGYIPDDTLTLTPSQSESLSTPSLTDSTAEQDQMSPQSATAGIGSISVEENLRRHAQSVHYMLAPDLIDLSRIGQQHPVVSNSTHQDGQSRSIKSAAGAKRPAAFTTIPAREILAGLMTSESQGNLQSQHTSRHTR
jgi:hypothetical protein